MITKLKCISNIDSEGNESEYITVGKTYHGFMYGSLFFSETDDGEDLVVYPKNDAHGKWEVVN